MKWAWGIKAQYLKKYLSDDFDIDVHEPDMFKALRYDTYDCYLTFGHSFVKYLYYVPEHKRISGVTAHRDQSIVTELKKCTWYQANSKLLYNELLSWGFPAERTFYVPNGVDEHVFYPRTELVIDKVKFGHVAKNSLLKGHKFIKELESRGQTFIKHYNTLATAIPYTDMPRIYNSFDVLLIASKEDGTPNPALEAAACGRPIISNKIGNMPEFIIDIRSDIKNGNGILLDDLCLQSYLDVIQFLISNVDLVKTAGLNARRTIENAWTWSAMAENYRQLFYAALGRKNPC